MTARGRVELTGIAGALQVFEDLLVDAAEGVAVASVLLKLISLDLVDDLADQSAGLHVVVGVFKDITDHQGALAALSLDAG